METIEWLLPAELRYALGWMIIHSFWQIALVGLLLWLCQRLFSRSSMSLHYYTGLGGLLLIAGMAIGTFLISLPGSSSNALIPLGPLDLSTKTVEMYSVKSIDQLAGLGLILSKLEMAIPTLVTGWCFGALLFLIRFSNSMADLRGLKNKSQLAVDKKWLDIMQAQSAKLGIALPVRLFKSVHIGVPLTYGTLKPVILLPASLFLHLTPSQLEAILTHELAHIKRFDYAVNLVQNALEVVFFYHPVFWWINASIRESREGLADDTAIFYGISPKDLAHGLANTVNQSTSSPPDLAMASNRRKTPTLTRIKRIMGYKTSYSPPTPLSSLTMLVTFLLGAIFLVGASSNPQKETPEPLKSPSQSLILPLFDSAEHLRQLRRDSIPLPADVLTLDSLVLSSISPEDIALIEAEVLKAMTPFEHMDLFGPDSVPVFDWTSPPFPDFEFPTDMPFPNFDLGPDFELVLDPMPVSFDSIPWINFPDSFPFLGINVTGISKDSLKILEEQFKVKQEEWQRKFDVKQHAWHQKFQEKMEAWEKENKPRIEAFERKMEDWQKTNQPKMEEFQRKMEKWQEENESVMKEKMAEFEIKMEEWQREHQKQLEKHPKQHE